LPLHVTFRLLSEEKGKYTKNLNADLLNKQLCLKRNSPNEEVITELLEFLKTLRTKDEIEQAFVKQKKK
jgi:hypothetical protein